MPNWTKQQILFALRESGTTVAAIAERAEISRFTIYGALEQPYPKVANLISEALGKKPHDIWPDLYNKKGTRRGLLSRERAA
ncbi:helix-turn-helix domain-containing protein [Bosea sp. FBZP-16]|uniref:helix-turn-helix domain-containing protein n=1 Tax=Bosea sp. FBZP-16 TaxID=2065382 RepID=UPI000C318315|nr:helix-turn-helix domain-containing protein [Bosea sp. FBZP-16]